MIQPSLILEGVYPLLKRKLYRARVCSGGCRLYGKGSILWEFKGRMMMSL
jgi:hypothetical protein